MIKILVAEDDADNIAYIRLEAGTNLIGGQPISYENMRQATNLGETSSTSEVGDAIIEKLNQMF